MKNWLPFVSLPAFAIASVPASIASPAAAAVPAASMTALPRPLPAAAIALPLPLPAAAFAAAARAAGDGAGLGWPVGAAVWSSCWFLCSQAPIRRIRQAYGSSRIARGNITHALGQRELAAAARRPGHVRRDVGADRVVAGVRGRQLWCRAAAASESRQQEQ